MIAPKTAESEDSSLRSEPLLPPQVVRVSNGLGLTDYTRESVLEAMSRFPERVDGLVRQGAQRVVLAGVPISAQLGRPRVLELIEQTRARTGVPLDTAGEAVVAAMQHLGMARVTVASRWAPPLNEALAAYLQHAGIEVVFSTAHGQWAAEAFAMSLEMGVRLAFELGRQALRQAPEADGLLMPGGTWRSLTVVPILEEDFAKPVVTNGNSRAWRLIHDGLGPPLPNWGRLLAEP